MKTRFRNLRRIVPADPQAGEAIQVLALEFYDEGVAVRWGALPSEQGGLPGVVETGGLDPVQLSTWTFGAMTEPGAFPEALDEPGVSPLGHVRVADDLQTSYESAGWSGEALRGSAYFTPAIPDEASWVEVSARAGVLRIDL
jgi:hypothetical protein